MDGRVHPTRLRTSDLPGPDSATWKYAGLWHVMLLGTLRNLVLEVAFPTVAQGVADHSHYHEDPWGRLNHTFKSYQRYVYGSPHDTLAEARELRRIHGAVHGVGDDGRPYHALDPVAYFWVHATLFASLADFYEAAGRPLPDDELERVYGEWRALGVVLGIRADHMPPDAAAFRRYFDGVVEGQLGDNPVVRDLLGPAVLTLPSPTALIPEPVWRVAWFPVSRLYLHATVALLPRPFTERLGIAPGPLQVRATQAFARALDVGTSLLPRPLRYLPRASAAIRSGQHHHPRRPTHVLARLIDRVPREPLPEDAEAYLAILETVLHSHALTVAEVATLGEVVAELGLSPDTVHDLHRDYLAALMKAAVEDGTLSNTDREHLDSVATLFDLVEASAGLTVSHG